MNKRQHLILFAPCILLASISGTLSATHYVDQNSTNATPPYTDWATAATNIQDAVDAAVAGDELVVTNGTYATGGRRINGTPNRVAVDKPLNLRSVNGPQFTTITGAYVRCAYLTNSASLSGFTLTGGDGGDAGGGVYCASLTAVVSNCVVQGNAAHNYQQTPGYCVGNAYGGGAYGGTLNNCTFSNNSAQVCPGMGVGAYGGAAYGCTLNTCTLTGNSASSVGGGAYGCTLNNCTLTGNSANFGGGGADFGCMLNNCIVYFNMGANYGPITTFNHCCTTPQPTNGFGNITNAPLFADYANGNLRLQPNSPCINAGKNALAAAGPDLDGNPRIKGGTVDMGAYEFQTPTSIISYAWLQQYDLPTDGSADFADPDYDGQNNWQEWACGTDPTNALSVLRLLTPVVAGTNVTLAWESVAGVNYFLQRNTNLTASSAFVPLATNLLGQAGTTSFTDTNAIGGSPFFYRIGVSNP